MKKLIAKTIEGKEFLHSKKDAFFCERNAQKIANALNDARYLLDKDEKWFVYDYDFMQEYYVSRKIYSTAKGAIKTKNI